MSVMAQRIDDDNQKLMKQNHEYQIQYLCQENDRDLLLGQILHQKKQQ